MNKADVFKRTERFLTQQYYKMLMNLSKLDNKLIT